MYSKLYEIIENTLHTVLNVPFALFGSEVPEWLVFLHLSLIFGGVCLMGFISVLAFASVWAERKISAHMQARLGPMEVGGFHGWLQTVADALKLLLKEDIVPAGADKVLFMAAPMLVFAGSLMAYVTIPFGPHLNVAALNLGLFYVLATGALVAVGIIMAGWSSHNKWSIYGGMRAAAQYVDYEIPSTLHLLPGVIMAGSLNMVTVADTQAFEISGWDCSILTWAVWPWINPFATVSFIMFYIAGLAETNRTPFDLAESESELVAGTHTEYSGIRWSFFFLAEYADMFVVSIVASIVYLGGWHGIPGIPPVAEVMLKTFGLMFITIWLRWTLPRLRVDQLTYLCWKVLLPFGLVTFLGTAFWIQAFGNRLTVGTEAFGNRSTAGAIVGGVLFLVVVGLMLKIWKSEPAPKQPAPQGATA